MGWPGMCPTAARRVTLLTCICRNSAAALAFTGLSDGCGAFLGISSSVVISTSMHGQIGMYSRCVGAPARDLSTAACIKVVMEPRVFPDAVLRQLIGRAESEPTAGVRTDQICTGPT